MQRRWRTSVLRSRQFLSRASGREGLGRAVYNVSDECAQAGPLGRGTEGLCRTEANFAQFYRPWFSVYRDWTSRLGDQTVTYKVGLGPVYSRLKVRNLLSTLVDVEDEVERKVDECGGTDDEGDRREKIQNEIVDRFENLLQKWNSNTPLLLNGLQVQLTPAIVCQVLKNIRRSDPARKFFRWATTQTGYQHNVYTYAALLDHYGKAKNFQAMDQVVAEMRDEGCALDTVTFTSLMHWHAQVKSLTGIRRVWQLLQEEGCKPNEYIYTSFIVALVNGGCHEEAANIFKEMQDAGCPPNIFTYSVIIHSLIDTGQLEAVCELYEKMAERKYRPNGSTYSIVVKANAIKGNVEKAVYFYKQMLDAGMRPSLSLRSFLSEILTEQGRLTEAENLTQISVEMAVEKQKSKEREAALHGSLPRPEKLAELLREWGPETDRALLRVKLKMKHPYLLNVLTLVKNEPEAAWRFFEWIRAQEQYFPTKHMFTKVLDIMGKRGHNVLQEEVLLEAESQTMGNTAPYAKLINSYCYTKHTDAALQVFERMKDRGCKPDANIFTMLIDLLSRTQDHTKSMEMYAQMLKANCKPTVHTYTVIIHSLARSGRVRAALTLFEKLPSFGMSPNIETYTIMLKACLKTRELERVLKLYASMRADGVLPSRATHRLVTRELHAAGMHDEADALSNVEIHFPDSEREIPPQRIPRARKSVHSIVSKYYS